MHNVCILYVVGRSPVDARGGQLEIAGVVVGSWGPNIPSSGRGRNSGLSPRVMSVGRGGNEGNGYPNRYIYDSFSHHSCITCPKVLGQPECTALEVSDVLIFVAGVE